MNFAALEASFLLLHKDRGTDGEGRLGVCLVMEQKAQDSGSECAGCPSQES